MMSDIHGESERVDRPREVLLLELDLLPTPAPLSL
jgi:hypothetical protein